MKKYNKASIMSRAHSIRREGKSMSEAMKAAWAEAKIDRIDTALFSLEMKDRWTREERELASKLNRDRAALAATIERKPEAPKAAAAAPKMIENPALTETEKTEIRNRMFRLFLNISPANMAEYKQLEARLYVAA